MHFIALVIDGHCDSIGDQLSNNRWLGDRSNTGHIDLPRLREGGVDAQFFACYVPVSYQHPSIRQTKTAGKLAAIPNLEGAEAVE